MEFSLWWHTYLERSYLTYLYIKQYCVKALPGLFSVFSKPKKLRLMGHSFTVQMNVNIAYPFYSGPEYRNI
ncbi:uncharacterized protein DC041_0006779 [Schistosoma bovis]|uniref:Uncharacterized protein n=1 Tax=Schistosoma bovis TaxID=6184 RepID=A0A430QM36_SCHBO|nr:uncharacterized protein DC041_0006779 [Schistosoma bovis]